MILVLTLKNSAIRTIDGVRNITIQKGEDPNRLEVHFEEHEFATSSYENRVAEDVLVAHVFSNEGRLIATRIA